MYYNYYTRRVALYRTRYTKVLLVASIIIIAYYPVPGSVYYMYCTMLVALLALLLVLREAQGADM